MVPHVPDECYLAGGYDPRGSENIAVPVAGIAAPGDEVPLRMVRFKAPQHKRLASDDVGEVAVFYFFSVNGGYATGRDGVRVKLSNPLEQYAYYAKIEISFTDDSLLRAAGPDASRRALGPLLEALMPVLYGDHIDLSVFAEEGAGPPPADA
jgi:hypothetical protein